MKRLFILLQRILPQRGLSRMAGRLGQSELGWLKRAFINLFIRTFNVDMSESLRAVHEFSSFNDFFTRQLKPGIRPIDTGDDVLVSPADGTVSELGSIGGARILQAKGFTYSLEQLLGNGAGAYENGSFLTVYLSPRDYHRVHMPVSGNLRFARYIPGRLFSVNPTTVASIPDLFSRNERLVCEFATAFGKVAVIMVGAMIVAGIKPVWRNRTYESAPLTEQPDSPPFRKGNELGQFQMGSTVIVLTGRRVEWSCAPGQSLKMGSRAGSLRSALH